MARLVAIAQGLYFVVSGLWPVLHLPSFLQVTGPKTDLWLVQSFGLLVTGIGLGLLLSTRQHREQAALPIGLATATALCAADIWFVSQGVISNVYLLDAAAEAVLGAGWLGAWSARGRP